MNVLFVLVFRRESDLVAVGLEFLIAARFFTVVHGDKPRAASRLNDGGGKVVFVVAGPRARGVRS